MTFNTLNGRHHAGKLLIKHPLQWITVAGMTVWLLSPGWLDLVAVDATIWTWRRQMTLLSGLLALVAMTTTLALAIRPCRMIRKLGHQYPAYSLHRRCGSYAVILSITHWLLVEAPRWAWRYGLYGSVNRNNHAPLPELPITWDTLAQQAGNVSLYLILVLMVLALCRQHRPHRLWHRAHQLFAPLFLLIVFHSLVLMPEGWRFDSLVIAGSTCLGVFSIALWLQKVIRKNTFKRQSPDSAHLHGTLEK